MPQDDKLAENKADRIVQAVFWVALVISGVGFAHSVGVLSGLRPLVPDAVVLGIQAALIWVIAGSVGYWIFSVKGPDGEPHQ